MTIYTCSNCQKDFGQKSNYISHLNRKFPCKSTVSDNTCQGCRKEFASRYSLLRHQSKGTCKILLPVEELSIHGDKVCQGCFKEFVSHSSMVRHQSKRACKTIIELRQRVLELESKACSSSVLGSNNTFNTIIKVDSISMSSTPACSASSIIIFGEEDLDSIPLEVRKDMIQSPYSLITKYVRHVHLNPLIPEQHNINLTNLRGNVCQVVGKDGQIETRIFSSSFETILRGASTVIKICANDEEIKLTPAQTSDLKDLHEKIRFHETGEAKVFIDASEDQVKRLLYDKRKMTSKAMKSLK